MANVLDKADKSMAPSFGTRRAPVPKREKFSWSSPSSPGKYMLVPKKELHIDDSYQRGEVSRAKVLEIARNWDWRLFGTVSTVRRSDGSLWVYDGGHRTRASYYRDDIMELPCMVFEADGIEDEAKAFVGTNTMKSNVSAYHVFRASVKAGEPIALATQAMLEKFGYQATSDKRAYGLQAIATARRMIKEDRILAERVFGTLTDIAVDGEHIPRSVLGGLFLLAKKLEGRVDILANDWRDRLMREGIAGMEIAIRREKHILGKGGDTIGAKAILDLLNKGKRQKLKMP